MRIDRDLQLKILQQLRECYPAAGYTNQMAKTMEVDHGHLCQNALYLGEHDLLDGEIRMSTDGRNTMLPCRFMITAKGLDFLEEDGGLSAILGTVTVRLHADSIRDLIARQVESSDLPEPQKAGLLSGLKGLKKAGLEEAVKYLVQQGLARSPDAIPHLQRLFQSVLT